MTSRKLTRKSTASGESGLRGGVGNAIPAAARSGISKERRAINAAGARRYNLQYELGRLRFVSPPDPIGAIDTRLAAYQQATVDFIEEIISLSASLSPADFATILSTRAKELDLLWKFQAAVRAEYDAYRKVMDEKRT